MNVGISTFRIFIMYVFISDMLPTLYHYKTTTPMFLVPFRPSLDQNILISKNKTALTSLRGGLTMDTIFVYFVRLIIPHSLYKQTSHY